MVQPMDTCAAVLAPSSGLQKERGIGRNDHFVIPDQVPVTPPHYTRNMGIQMLERYIKGDFPSRLLLSLQPAHSRRLHRHS
jgi:hypothetical protein